MRLHACLSVVLLAFSLQHSSAASSGDFIGNDSSELQALRSDFQLELGWNDDFPANLIAVWFMELPNEIQHASRSLQYPKSYFAIAKATPIEDPGAETPYGSVLIRVHDEFYNDNENELSALSVVVLSVPRSENGYYVAYSHNILELAETLGLNPSQSEYAEFAGQRSLTPVARFDELSSAIQFAELESASHASMSTRAIGVCNGLDVENNPTLVAPRDGETTEQYRCRMEYYSNASRCCSAYERDRRKALERLLKRVGGCTLVGGTLGAIGGGIPGSIAGGAVGTMVCAHIFAFGYEAEIRLATSAFRSCLRSSQQKRMACDPSYDPCNDPDTQFLCYLPDCPCTP